MWYSLHSLRSLRSDSLRSDSLRSLRSSREQSSRGSFIKEAAWSNNLQRLKLFLEGSPLLSNNINDAKHIQFLKEYAKKYNLPTPKTSDLKNEKAQTIPVRDYETLFQEHPEIKQDWEQYQQAKNEWIQSLPEKAVPYVEGIFSNTPMDMLEHHQKDYSNKTSTRARLNTAKWWLQENKKISIPDVFEWKKYPAEIMRNYTKFQKQQFIDWDKYFEDNPHLKQEYEKYQAENKYKKFNDPRDMLTENSPSYEPYINHENVPVSWQDTTDYIFQLPQEHKERITPYFLPYADEPEYGTPEEQYPYADELDHGNALGYIHPGNYDKGWMIHHSPNAEQIAKEGFQKGVTLQEANDLLVKTDGGSGKQGFNYAFDAEHQNPTWHGGKAVIFPGHFLNIQHERNEDNYVLFDGREISPEQIFPIVKEQEIINEKIKYGWSVYDASGRKLIDKLPLKDVIEWVKENNGMLQDVKKKQSTT